MAGGRKRELFGGCGSGRRERGVSALKGYFGDLKDKKRFFLPKYDSRTSRPGNGISVSVPIPPPPF